MEEITLQDGVNVALSATLQDRLAAICGAGLSMAEPSKLPSAGTIAQSAKQKYDHIYGATAPPLSEDIEEQAEHFYALDQLETMYLGSLIDHNTFSAPHLNAHKGLRVTVRCRAAIPMPRRRQYRPTVAVGLAIREWRLSHAKRTSSGSSHMSAMCQQQSHSGILIFTEACFPDQCCSVGNLVYGWAI